MSLGTSNRDGGRTNEAGHLRPIAKGFEGDVLEGLTATQRAAGANMSVDIAVGDALLRRSDGTYAHPAFNDAVYNQVIAAADGSNPRRDVVVMYVDYAETPSTGVSNNTNGVVKITSVSGTAAGSPVDPSDVTIQSAVGSGNPWTKLARVRLGATTTSVTDSLIDDVREMATVKRRRSPVEAMLGETQIYTAGTTWTKKLGLKYVVVQVMGGGGGGGGAASAGASNCAQGGGGGAGGYSRKKVLEASLGSTETVTVGAAGAAASAGANSGGAGGNSSFGAHATANGGGGGTGGTADTGNQIRSGGAGGSAASGDINVTGQSGMFGRISGGWPFSSASGGNTALGSGGKQNTGSSGAGGAASGYGAGGGGGMDQGTSTARAGGAGAGGIVIVEEYY